MLPYDVRLSLESFSRVKEPRGVSGCLQRGYQEVIPRLKLVTQSLVPEQWKLRSLRENPLRSHMPKAAAFILLDTHNYLLSMAGCI